MPYNQQVPCLQLYPAVCLFLLNTLCSTLYFQAFIPLILHCFHFTVISLHYSAELEAFFLLLYCPFHSIVATLPRIDASALHQASLNYFAPSFVPFLTTELAL